METTPNRVAHLQRTQKDLEDEYQMLQMIGGLNHAKYQQLNILLKKNQKKLDFYEQKKVSIPVLNVSDFLM